MMTGRVRRIAVLAAVLYVTTAAALTWVAYVEPYTYAYWFRFVLLFPSSILAFYLDYFGGIILFGPDPTGALAHVYFFAVGAATLVAQFSVASLVGRSVCQRRQRRRPADQRTSG